MTASPPSILAPARVKLGTSWIESWLTSNGAPLADTTARGLAMSTAP